MIWRLLVQTQLVAIFDEIYFVDLSDNLTEMRQISLSWKTPVSIVDVASNMINHCKSQ